MCDHTYINTCIHLLQVAYVAYVAVVVYEQECCVCGCRGDRDKVRTWGKQSSIDIIVHA